MYFNQPSFTADTTLRDNPPRRRFSWEFLVGVCRPVLQILTRFQTQKCNFLYPFSYQTSNIHTRFKKNISEI